MVFELGKSTLAMSKVNVVDSPSFGEILFLENIKKFALVKVRLCATCSAKLNSNKKYREVRKEQNRLALLREKEERLDQKREKANYEKRKRKLSEEKSKNPDEPKKKLTDREQKEKIKMDEADLGSTKGNFKIFKGSPDQSHFIFELNVGQRRIRHTTTLNLNLQSISN